ncbi:hypothetical protein L0Z72_10600 [candidate division KSB1 bacterium]|nr:hypothetical protein [candidate division KSB1 bacterium]
MSRIAGLNNIHTSQKVHLRSISQRRRSKFLCLFMLDNERQLLEKDNQILIQRHHRNAERIKTINTEISKSIRLEMAEPDAIHDAPTKNVPFKKWRVHRIED